GRRHRGELTIRPRLHFHGHRSHTPTLQHRETAEWRTQQRGQEEGARREGQERQEQSQERRAEGPGRHVQ
ncbi:hypothetical protein M9458_048279, partial [Cirrhinus mrigala]